MKRSRSVVTIALLGGWALAFGLPAEPAAAADPAEETVLAKVDDEAITMADLETVLTAMEGVRGAPGSMNLTADEVLQRLIQNRLLEHEAIRMGIERRPEVANQVADLLQHKSMMALLDSVAAGAEEMTEEELERYMGPPTTMNRIAHILLDNAVTANALLDSLADGIPFADLEDRYSLDTTYAQAGGDLGWSGEGKLIPEFETAIRGLAPGQVGAPAQTDQGWHLVQLTETRVERLGDSDKMKTAVREAEMKTRVMKRVDGYVASLKEKHGVVVDEELLQSLDFGSTDSAVQNELRESKAVLATLGKRPFTVGGLTFKIRFQNFHGVEGKPDVDAIRDKVFNEWLTESILRYEAVREGYPNKPEIAQAGAEYERQLLREEVLAAVLESPAEPSEDDLAAYHQANLDEFTPRPRVKLDGVFLVDRDAAVDFRKKLDEGAQLGWLSDRATGILDPEPEVFIDWLEASVFDQLGMELKKGVTLGPFVIREAWAVAKVLDLETVQPTPLDKCANKVRMAVKNVRMKESVGRALEQLEMQSEIKIEKDANRLISERLDEWLSS